jgi:uncharacterized membrane protein YbhN (UPF0104 family)
VRRAISLLAGLFLLAVLVLAAGPAHVARLLASVRPSVLAASLTLLVLLRVGLFIRWMMLVRPVAPAPIGRHLRIFLTGSFLNSFGPGNVAGDSYRVASLRPFVPSTGEIVGCVVRERLYGLAGYLMGYLVAFALCLTLDRVGHEEVFAAVAAVSLAGLVGLLALPLAAGRLARFPSRARLAWLQRWVADTTKLGPSRRAVQCLAISLAGWGLWCLAVIVLGRGLGLELPVPILAVIATLTELIRFVPVSFQGLGVREVAFAGLVELAGGPPARGASVAIVLYLLVGLTLLAGAPLSWLVGAYGSRTRSGAQQGHPSPPAGGQLCSVDEPVWYRVRSLGPRAARR